MAPLTRKGISSSYAYLRANDPFDNEGGESNQQFNNAIFALLILGGHVCFPVMLLFIFISRRSFSRSSLFLHFCFTWVVHSVGFSIL
jgi:hypothetical protein